MASNRGLDLTALIGDCGPFQVLLGIAVNVTVVLAVWGITFMVFGIYNPGWICLDHVGNHNRTISEEEMTLSLTSTSSHVTWAENVTTWSLNCDVKERCGRFMYNPHSSTVVTEWDLSCDKAWIPSIIISIVMSGVLVGAYLSGQLGDRFGRKVSLYSHIALSGIGHLTAIFPVSWQMYAASAFVIGTGVGGLLACSFPYTIEFMSERWRGIYAALPIWNMGTLTFGLLVFAVRDWRYVHVAGASLSILIFLPVFWTPESVRWLSVNGKLDTSKRVVEKIARMNGHQTIDTDILNSFAYEEKDKIGTHKYTYLDLFKLAETRYYTIKFGFIWISLAISYYAISFGVKSMSGNFYINLLLFAVFEFPATVSIAPVVNRLGRRTSSILYFGIAATSALCLAIVSLAAPERVKVIVVLCLALLCKTVTLGAWYIVSVFSSELYPTVIRSLHYGFLNGIARIGSMLSPYLIADDPSTLHVPFFVIGFLYLLLVWILWTLPETKGRAITDFAQQVDVDAKAKPDDQARFIPVSKVKPEDEA